MSLKSEAEQIFTANADTLFIQEGEEISIAYNANYIVYQLANDYTKDPQEQDLFRSFFDRWAENYMTTFSSRIW